MTVKLPRARTLLLAPLVLFGVFYLVGVVIVATDDRAVEGFDPESAISRDIAIFGASGTAGDGILKASLADPQIRKIHVSPAAQRPASSRASRPARWR